MTAITIHITGGEFNDVGGQHGASQDFKNSLHGKTDAELAGMLKNPALSKDQKMAVLDQLAKQKKTEMQRDAGKDNCVGNDIKELERLMKALKNGNISEADLEKLAGMLGADPQDLKEEKGAGHGHEGGGSDIQIDIE